MSKKTYAALLSGAVVPGAGQIYKRHFIKGGLLLAATCVVLAMVCYTTVMSMQSIMETTPPDEILMNVLGISHRIVEMNKSVFAYLTIFLVIIWLAGIIDALLTEPTEKPQPNQSESNGRG